MYTTSGARNAQHQWLHLIQSIEMPVDAGVGWWGRTVLRGRWEYAGAHVGVGLRWWHFCGNGCWCGGLLKMGGGAGDF
jgi:hypothetical protein